MGFLDFSQTSGFKQSASFLSLAVILSMLQMWSNVEGWSYHYSDTTMTWAAARAWCRQNYTDMVVIQNQEEIEHLNRWLPFKRSYYWIGIRKINNIWTWVGTNKPLMPEATNWATGEPNNGRTRRHGVEEDCVEMYIKRAVQPGKWNDEKCQKQKTALCYAAACKNDSCLYGDCIETINSHRCECSAGFYGEKCDQVVQCPALSNPDKGSMECSHPLGPYSYQTTCMFTCDEGYMLVGSSDTVQCEASGTWNSAQPFCVAVQCPALHNLENGIVNCGDDSEMSFSYQGTCSFGCGSGYMLVGPSSITCTSAAEWSDGLPHCEAITR